MSKIGAFIAGGIVGASAALLFAAQNGEQNRSFLEKKARNAWNRAKQACPVQDIPNIGNYNCADFAAKGADFAQAAAAKGQEIYSRAASYAREAADSVAPVFANVTSNDELREKIEAARARIAAQVAANTQAAYEAMDADEVVVEAVEVEEATAAQEDAPEA